MARKIAITVLEDNGRDAHLDPRFGRARGFLIVEEGVDGERHISNPNIDVNHGAGTGSAATMQELGVQAVVSGEFGPKAFEALGGMGIEMYLATEGSTVHQVLEQLAQGTLTRKQLSVYR